MTTDGTDDTDNPWLASAETGPQISPVRDIRGWLLRRASRTSRGVVTTDHTALQISPIRAIRGFFCQGPL